MGGGGGGSVDFKIHPLCETFDQTSSQGLGRGEKGGE